MDYLYGYLSKTPSNVGAALIEIKNGVQFLTPDVANMVMSLLTSRYLVPAGTPTEKATQFFAVSKEKLAEMGLSSKDLQTAAAQIQNSSGYILVTEEDVKSIAGTPSENFRVVFAKDLATAKSFSDEGLYAVLASPKAATEKKPGVKPAALVAAVVGGGVGALVAGVPGALIGGIGAGVLVQQVA